MHFFQGRYDVDLKSLLIAKKVLNGDSLVIDCREKRNCGIERDSAKLFKIGYFG